MSLFWFSFGVAAVIATLWLVAVMLEKRERLISRTKRETKNEVQDDVHLRDVVLANDVRDRVADVPDRLPEPEPGATTAAKPLRRGRRGAT